MQLAVFGAVCISTQGRIGNLDVQRGRDEAVASGHVLVDEAVIGQVLHGTGDLLGHPNGLGDRQRGRLRRIGTGHSVLACRQEKLLQVSLK